MRITAIVLAAVSALATAACMTGPVSGTTWEASSSDPSSPHIPFGGFVRDPGATVVFEAGSGSTWHSIGGITASTEAAFPAGAFCPNSPALYTYSEQDFHGLHQLANPGWKSVSKGRWSITIRAHQNDGPNAGIGLFFTDRADSIDCMLQYEGNPDCDFTNVAAQCGYNLNEATLYMHKP